MQQPVKVAELACKAHWGIDKTYINGRDEDRAIALAAVELRDKQIVALVSAIETNLTAAGPHAHSFARGILKGIRESIART